MLPVNTNAEQVQRTRVSTWKACKVVPRPFTMGIGFTIGFGGSVKAVLTAVRQFKISVALYIDANVTFSSHVIWHSPQPMYVTRLEFAYAALSGDLNHLGGNLTQGNKDRRIFIGYRSCYVWMRCFFQHNLCKTLCFRVCYLEAHQGRYCTHQRA